MSANTSSGVYKWLNNHRALYFIAGIISFFSGIIIGLVYGEETYIWVKAISHFLLIFGEVLVVFFFVNIVLEEDTKQKMKESVEQIIGKKEQEILSSFTTLSDNLITGTKTLSEGINNNIFKAILKERTCVEIADIVSKDDFFKTDFLKTQALMEYKFEVKQEPKPAIIYQLVTNLTSSQLLMKISFWNPNWIEGQWCIKFPSFSLGRALVLLL
jgi:hypothetical protein